MKYPSKVKRKFTTIFRTLGNYVNVNGTVNTKYTQIKPNHKWKSKLEVKRFLLRKRNLTISVPDRLFTKKNICQPFQQSHMFKYEIWSAVFVQCLYKIWEQLEKCLKTTWKQWWHCSHQSVAISLKQQNTQTLACTLYETWESIFWVEFWQKPLLCKL